MEEDNAQRAAKAREQGNAFYKQGKLSQAAKLTPSDAAPFSNLSAVKFEKGEYADAAKFAAKALSLNSDAEVAAKAEKLYVRLAKSYLCDLKLDEATEVAEKIAAENVRASWLADINQLRDVADSASDDKKKSTMRKQILDRLPLFRPGLSKNLKYYAVGHDDAQAIWESTLFHLTSDGGLIAKYNKLSVLYCGFGDARNFFASIIQSFMFTHIGQCPEVHYTLLDIKAASLARLMLLLELTEEAGKEPLKRNSDERNIAAKMIITTMPYVYNGHIYPPWVHDRVQHALEKLMAKMEKNDKPIFDWLYVPKSTREAVLGILRNWKGPAKDWHTTATVRNAVIRDRQGARMQKMAMGVPQQTPENCELDRDYFDSFAFLPPPDSIAPTVEPALATLLEAYDEDERGAGKALEAYVDANWKVNVTMIDMEWEKEWRSFEPDGGRAEVTPFIHFDPLEILTHLSSHMAIRKANVGKDENTIGLIGIFFDLVIDTLWLPDGPKMTVEVVLGEMTDFMERLRYDCREFRSKFQRMGLTRQSSPRPMTGSTSAT